MFDFVIEDCAIIYDSTGDLGIGGGKGAWGSSFHAAVFFADRLDNEKKAVDSFLCKLYRCLGVTCKNRPITGCYNTI